MLRHPGVDHGLRSEMIVPWKSRRKAAWGESTHHGSGLSMLDYSILWTLGLLCMGARVVAVLGGTCGRWGFPWANSSHICSTAFLHR